MIRRGAALVVILAALAYAIATAGGAVAGETRKAEPRQVQVTYQGKTVRWWARHAVAARRQANVQLAELRAARAKLAARVAPLENAYEHAATLAAIAYRVDAATLIRKGRCESVNWTQFDNKSSDAAGPWQFLGSTWATTPYAAFSPYDPFAAALAAAWMHTSESHPPYGRGGEWVCR